MADSDREEAPADERTPLIAPAPETQPQENGRPIEANDKRCNCDSERNQEDEQDVPLPKIQILLLCYARIVEPVAFFSIFPFVNQMIFETGNVKKEDVGFYSGLIESLFSLTQTLLMVAWGRAADRFGRKPVLVLSLCGASVACSLFGFATTIWQMVAFRCLAGAFGGTVVTLRAMFTENSTPKTQARAFSFFAFSSNLGIFVGPLLGGGLAKPATEFPKVFGHVQLFKDFPYALPTLVTGCLAASAAILCALFLKETLKSQKDGEPPPQPASALEVLKAPGVRMVLLIYASIMVLAFGYTAVIPVFYFTDVKLGGFQFNERTIALFMGLGGFSQAMWLLLVFPWLQHRVGTGGVMRLCSYVWPVFFIFNPLGNYLLKNQIMPLFWTLVIICTALGSGVAMSFTAIQLCVNDISPSSAVFGTLNSIALALISGLRAFVPALFSSLYATGVNLQILNGEFIWLILIICAILFAVVLRWLPEKAQGRPTQQTSRRSN